MSMALLFLRDRNVRHGNLAADPNCIEVIGGILTDFNLDSSHNKYCNKLGSTDQMKLGK